MAQQPDNPRQKAVAPSGEQACPPRPNRAFLACALAAQAVWLATLIVLAWRS